MLHSCAGAEDRQSFLVSCGMLGSNLGSNPIGANVGIVHQIISRHIYVNLSTEDDIGSRWVVEKVLCQRVCIAGRATHVYSLVRAGEPVSGGVTLVPLKIYDSDNIFVAPPIIPIALPAAAFDRPHRYLTRYQAKMASNPPSTSSPASRGKNRKGLDSVNSSSKKSQAAAVPKVHSYLLTDISEARRVSQE